MRRETQNVLLVLVGGALGKLALTGTYTRYVKPSMGPWLVVAGALMVLLAVVAIVRDIVSARGAPGPTGDAHGHQHGTRSPWLLVLPVLAVFLIAPPALGADSVTRAGTRKPVAPAMGQAAFPPLPGGRVLDMSLSDFVTRAGYDTSGSLRSRTVRLTGFVARDGDTTYLARLVITCCAADAMPLKVRLAAADLAVLRSDEWVQVTGTLGATGLTPTVRMAELRPIAEPPDPYEH